MTAAIDPPSAWADACRAAAMFAAAPQALGGIVLRARAGPVRERWLALLRRRLPVDRPSATLPSHIGDDRLLGGLDLAATVRRGAPVIERGLLARVDGGALFVPMAERLEPALVARLGGVLDDGAYTLARDAVATRVQSRIGVVACDEGADDEEHVAAALADRLALHIDLGALSWGEVVAPDDGAPANLAAAGARWSAVHCGEPAIEAVCEAALALGIDSARVPVLALRAARVAAALDGRTQVDAGDLALVARLVLAPRARRWPAGEEGADDSPATQDPPDEDDASDAGRTEAQSDAGGPTGAVPDRQGEHDTVGDAAPDAGWVVAAARSALGAGRLMSPASHERSQTPARAAGRSGATLTGTRRGRPAGTTPGDPRRGARLSLIDTLRAAVPWQALRRRAGAPAQRIVVAREDFRVTRFRERRRTTTVFAIDASGSTALQRLGEAKGAVELLLADCYVRRDQVAVIAFRGAGAELVLPPTRSLVRAKRSLTGLPGGGGTPLAAGLDAALALAQAAARRGETPLVVLLTDGRGNIARDGTPDRTRAEHDALAAAARWRSAGVSAMVIDTSARPEPRARALAERMQARYLPLPHAQARGLLQAARQVGAAQPGA